MRTVGLMRSTGIQGEARTDGRARRPSCPEEDNFLYNEKRGSRADHWEERLLWTAGRWFTTDLDLRVSV